MHTRTLTVADNGTRVRVDSPVSTDLIEVVVGHASQAWTNGTYIEIVRLPNCVAPVTIIAAVGASLVDMGGSLSLEQGEYARVSKVSGEPNTWDVHVYRLSAGGGADRVTIIDNEFTENAQAPGTVLEDVSLMTLGNGLSVRAWDDKGGTAGKYVLITPSRRFRTYNFDNEVLT